MSITSGCNCSYLFKIYYNNYIPINLKYKLSPTIHLGVLLMFLSG